MRVCFVIAGDFEETTANEFSNVPTISPFLAHVGNLPLDATESDLADVFHSLKIKDIYVVQQKGFGYVEFDTREDLISALSLDRPRLKNRDLRVAVADKTQVDRGGRSNDRSRFVDRGNRGYYSNYANSSGPQLYPSYGITRSSSYTCRIEPPFPPPSSLDYHEPPRYGYDTSSTYNGYDNDREPLPYRKNSAEPRMYPTMKQSSYSSQHSFEPADSSYYGRSSTLGRDRRQYRRERYPPFANANDVAFLPRRDLYSRFPRDYETWPDLPPRPDEVPKERKKLELVPRSRPLSGDAPDPAAPSKSSIFGEAKPVDTAAKEREIEERLERERQELHRQLELEQEAPFATARSNPNIFGYCAPGEDSSPKSTTPRAIEIARKPVDVDTGVVYGADDDEGRPIKFLSRCSSVKEVVKRESSNAIDAGSNKGVVAAKENGKEDGETKSKSGDRRHRAGRQRGHREFSADQGVRGRNSSARSGKPDQGARVGGQGQRPGRRDQRANGGGEISRSGSTEIIFTRGPITVTRNADRRKVQNREPAAAVSALESRRKVDESASAVAQLPRIKEQEISKPPCKPVNNPVTTTTTSGRRSNPSKVKDMPKYEPVSPKFVDANKFALLDEVNED
ncbi:unnamed protein product [Soboliphyme baturini]|uniref:RRM domain-containing protein n=1 Tax=Soboliphyme baturini TaxID=241478 RepID=A0A183IFR4_9BILA|nr:unnamed protein product [Soboliphyme baturini]